MADKSPRTSDRPSPGPFWFPGAASHGDGKADPGMLAVFQDYVRLMPLVAEANQMGEELKKVRAGRRSNAGSGRTSGNRVHGPSPPTPQPALPYRRGHGAWRGEGLHPGPRSEPMTEPRPTPRPQQSQLPAPCLPWPPRLPRPPRPSRLLDQCLLARPPLPGCPPERASLGPGP